MPTPRAKTVETTLRAFELRKAGMAYADIGQQIGLTKQRAHQIVTKHIADLLKRTGEDVEAVMRLELDRLDRMALGVWRKASAGDEKAIGAMVRIMDRRSKYLGLDAPVKTAQTNKQGEDAPIPLGPPVIIVAPPEPEDAEAWAAQYAPRPTQ